MLRPSDNLLDSSRAAYRRGVRAERLKTLWHVGRVLRVAISRAVTAVVELALLCGLPLAYLVAAYLALDLPARFVARRGAYGNLGAVLFVAALVVAMIGIVRAVQNAPPLAPVRPKFAKAMLGLSWVAAALFTVGDLAL